MGAVLDTNLGHISERLEAVDGMSRLAHYSDLLGASLGAGQHATYLVPVTHAQAQLHARGLTGVHILVGGSREVHLNGRLQVMCGHDVSRPQGWLSVTGQKAWHASRHFVSGVGDMCPSVAAHCRLHKTRTVDVASTCF